MLFELAYRLAPGFRLFQRQERLLGVYSLSGALLAAQGMALWLRPGPGLGLAVLRRSAWTVGGGLLLAALVLFTATGVAAPGWPVVWGRQLLVASVVMALLWGRQGRRARASALILLLGVDLYVSTLGAGTRRAGSPSAFWPHPEWLGALRSTSPARIDSGRLLYANVGEIYGLEDVGGISPLRPRALDELRQLPPVRRWQLLNVTHVLASAPPAEVPLTKVADIEEGLYPDRPLQAAVYRFDAALPRAWLSYEPLLAPNDAVALQLLADPAFDLATRVVLSGLQDVGGITPAPEGGDSEVQVSRLGPGALDIRLDSAQPGFLVISEWYYPGWQAELDGRRVPIHRANYAFQAVQVPAGRHRVVVRYVAWLEGLGVLASALALALAGLLAWRWRPAVGRRQPRPLRQPATPLAGRRLPWGAAWPWLGVALILLGFGLRVYRLGYQELRGDEAFSYLQVQHPLVEIGPRLLQGGDPHPPLHYWLLRVWVGPAGDSEFAMRYASLVPSVLLLPLLLARAVERSAWSRWALYAAACALTVYSHYYGVFALVAHGLCLLLVAGWRRRLGSWLASASAAGLTFAPWLLVSWPRVTAAGQLSEPSRPELAAHLTAVGSELAVGMALGLPLERWLFVAALALCILGARELFTRGRGWAVLLVAWLGGAALGIFLLRFSRATFNTFYILVASVPWWVLVAVGGQWLWRRGRPLSRALAAIVLAGLVAGNGVSLARYYFDPVYSRSGGYRGIASQVSAQGRAGDLFLRNFPDPCYDYYLRDVPLPRAMQPASPQAGLEETEHALAGLAAQYDRLWFVSARGSQWDPEGVVAGWLEHQALLEQETVHQGRTLRAYRPLHSAGQVMAPVGECIDGLVCLEGAFVTVNGRAVDLNAAGVAIPPGATVKVTLLWRPLTQTQEAYSVFVHLLGDDNRLVAQHDGFPVFGTRPGWTWTPGEPLLDRHDLSVPKDLSVSGGTLLVGLYASKTVTREPFASGRDAIPLARATFGRP